jgi:predicted kinase
MSKSALVVVSGLPGTGKSTIAGALADHYRAVLLSKDVIEAALWRRGVGRDQDSFGISHELITSLSEDALRRKQHVVIDTVATSEDVRSDWRNAARRCGSAFVVVLCLCSDESVHRSRIVGRDRGIVGWPELAWTDVERVAERFEPWTDVHLTVDAVEEFRRNFAAATALVDARIGEGRSESATP